MTPKLRKRKNSRAKGQTCTVDGCDRPVRCKMLCKKHYSKRLLYGDATAKKACEHGEGEAYAKSVLEMDTEECVLWPFARDAKGYPIKYKIDGEIIKVHRWITEQMHGAPTGGNMVRHLCGNGHNGCVNPKHLRWGTAQENADDKVRHGRSKRGSEHYKTKLNAIKVLEIKALLKAGNHTLQEIADLYDVPSKKTIGGIAEGRTWGWLECKSDCEASR